MPAAELPPLSVEPEFCLVSRRNNSLASGPRWAVFALLATVSLGLALAFAAAGAWMVLPYSVLEIALLALAFAWIERRAGDWERLTVAGDRVIVERQVAGKRSRREFNRWWLRVGMQAGDFMRPGALTLRCAGEEVAIGADLPPVEREAVGRRLRALVQPR